MKTKTTIHKITETVPSSFQKTSVTTYELINETKEFLNYYFKGAYKNSLTSTSYRRTDISLDGFSYILKLIFKAVFGRNLIVVSNKISEQNLIFNIEFDTSYLSAKDIELINKIAMESNIKFEFSKTEVALLIATTNDFMPTISAISIRKVYNSLKNIFFYIQQG